MTTISLSEPTAFIVGDTVKWRQSWGDYLPADGWVLKYVFIQGGDQQEITGTDNGDGTHLITITAAVSALFKTGDYHYQSYLTKGSERYTATDGIIVTKANFADKLSGYDARSIVKKTLDGIEALLLGKTNKDVQTASVNGRAITAMTPEDLLKWHSHYTQLYAQELNKSDIDNNKQQSRLIRSRFV